ncbi:MAG TPA: protoheme IX farnesyltransferase [Candidatus Paceibacterota bacterium]
MTSARGTAGAYYQITKPRMVYGNLLVAAAAMAYATESLDWALLAWMLGGLGCVIASACVFNNVYDRHMDAKMERTRERALVRGDVSVQGALVFGRVLLALGLAILFFFTNLVALGAALAGFVAYVFLYSPLKHYSPYALYVGAVAGATPPLVGYAAGAGMLDYQAVLLFAFLFVWQVPHFLAIAVYRHDEYAAAEVPLFMRGPYSVRQKSIARGIFYLSLLVLLLWCVWLATSQ